MVKPPDPVLAWVEIEDRQRIVCRQRGLEHTPAGPASKAGLAMATLGKVPINGLRHPVRGDTSGWYIWCGGEELSQAPDFFSPLHIRHLTEHCPQVLDFLGLPPGARFLIADGYADVWNDESLLDT